MGHMGCSLNLNLYFLCEYEIVNQRTQLFKS